MKATLSTLDLHEKPGQRITWLRKVQHHQIEQRVDLEPGDLAVFSAGPVHGYYGYAIESEDDPNARYSAREA